MTKKPIWLLDVDGVLNAVGHGDQNPYKLVKARANGRSWPISFRPAVIAFIVRMLHEELVEVHWLTTWGAEANDNLSEQLGLPGDFPVVGEPNHTSLDWWKFDLVRHRPDFFDRPIVWTDDDLPYSRRAMEFVRANEGNILGIAPDTYVGLTDENLSQIERFLTGFANAV